MVDVVLPDVNYRRRGLGGFDLRERSEDAVANEGGGVSGLRRKDAHPLVQPRFNSCPQIGSKFSVHANGDVAGLEQVSLRMHFRREDSRAFVR